MKQVNVYKGRTTILPVSLGYDVSSDVITSEIRADENRDSELIATWVVSFETDGTDGEIVLRLDDSVTADITQIIGYMDLKRVAGGEPINVFDEFLQVVFRETITV